MTKDVLITISGFQLIQDTDTQPIEVITPGKYYNRGGYHYILYDEVQEGFEGVTKNRIRISDGYMDIHKSGVSNTHMVFEKNRKNMTYYETPFGSLLLGIAANDIQVKEDEKNIQLNVQYNLEVNSRPLANCSIRMNIASREEGNFEL